MPGLDAVEIRKTCTSVYTWGRTSEIALHNTLASFAPLYGGIHFEPGDLNGRLLGRQVGEAVYEQAQFYLNGGERDLSSICGNWQILEPDFYPHSFLICFSFSCLSV